MTYSTGYIVCPNGEVIDRKTGIVMDFIDYQPEPPLSKTAQTLIQSWNGMSAESLGSIPKIITISREEQRLLSKLRPWKFLKYATKQEYWALVDRLNRHRLSVNSSVRMTIAWRDPDSAYNSPARALALSRAWADPDSGYNTQEFRDGKSAHFTALWADPLYKAGLIAKFRAKWADPVYKAKRIAQFLIINSASAIKGWETRRKNYPNLFKDPEATRERIREAARKRGNSWRKRVELYGPEGVKDPKLTSWRLRQMWGWRKLSEAMKMLFDGIVDENAESFPCPYCNRVFGSKFGVRNHVSHTPAHHKLRDLDELELKSYQNVVWAFHTNDYDELTGRQKRMLKRWGLTENKHGFKKGPRISLSRFGNDVLSTIDVNNAPLVRL